MLDQLAAKYSEDTQKGRGKGKKRAKPSVADDSEDQQQPARGSSGEPNEEEFQAARARLEQRQQAGNTKGQAVTGRRKAVADTAPVAKKRQAAASSRASEKRR